MGYEEHQLELKRRIDILRAENPGQDLSVDDLAEKLDITSESIGYARILEVLEMEEDERSRPVKSRIGFPVPE